MSRIASISVCGYKASVTVYEAANPCAPTILALHGFTGSGQDFGQLREQLGSDSAHWICPDFMGHGSSESPSILDPYQLPATLRLIDAARQLAPNPERVVLLAYSMGGRLALHYLRRVQPIPTILIGASPGLATPGERANRCKADQKWIQMLGRPDAMEIFAREWEKQSLIEPQTRLPEPMRSGLATRRRANNPIGLTHSLMGTGTGALSGLWDALADIHPVSLAFGSLDTKFAGIARKMADHHDRFQLVEIPNVGHAAHLEAPAEVADMLAELIQAQAW